MREFLRKIKLNTFATSLIYALVGLVLLVKPELSASVLCTLVGLVLVICGVVNILQFLVYRDGTLYTGGRLIFGLVLTAVGIWITTRPELISVVIPRVIGVIICVHGFNDIRSAVTLHRNSARWGAALLLAVVTLVLGVVLVLNPFDAFATFFFFLSLKDIIHMVLCLKKRFRGAVFSCLAGRVVHGGLPGTTPSPPYGLTFALLPNGYRGAERGDPKIKKAWPPPQEPFQGCRWPQPKLGEAVGKGERGGTSVMPFWALHLGVQRTYGQGYVVLLAGY